MIPKRARLVLKNGAVLTFTSIRKFKCEDDILELKGETFNGHGEIDRDVNVSYPCHQLLTLDVEFIR